MVSLRALTLGLLALPAALAADCYGSGNAGFSVTEYQQTAAQVCNYGPSASLVFGDTGFPNYYRRVVEASYTGTEKLHCWDAFNNIIAQCVQGSGRNGGQWTWDYGSDHEKYYIQSYYG
ncbi:hypothetical protein QBC33DRAFT_569268 [Phialemonium atrogriseum]|uniref:Uncharacterized protein n=1 Tax=Phialemonium atrogriseum TaxID=1093897 RepID=A0AAJ0C3X1_9PEZI|nr:uncharacterized protein QBC33DRAFT_569268 [Phialemonium atrogriseum]KAK1768232.1 hypothetical protein QBC33DRAFT_569268 [Phialemonium atrogriseum]